MKRYQKTDLACELYKNKTLSFNKFNLFGYEAFETTRHKKNKDKIEKSLTLCTGNLWKYNKDEQNKIENALSKLIDYLLLENTKAYKKILVLGLGNRDVSVDTLGPYVIDKMIPTGHIEDSKTKIFLLSPGVLGQTGFETFDIAFELVKQFEIDCVFTIDSLSTASIDRLSSTIQLSNCGIVPGSGNGVSRKEISEETLGIPVFSVGVPFVISSASLVSSCLIDAGIDQLSDEMEIILDSLLTQYVAPKDFDVILDAMSDVVAGALTKSLNKENIFPIF